MTGCVNWVGTKNDVVYGQTPIDGKMVYVHRIAWEKHTGLPSAGIHVHHTIRVARWLAGVLTGAFPLWSFAAWMFAL